MQTKNASSYQLLLQKLKHIEIFLVAYLKNILKLYSFLLRVSLEYDIY